jgi:large subunit ribosomal protein L18e
MVFNTMAENAVWTLRQAYKRNKAPIWRSLEAELSGPRRNRREINLGRLSEITHKDEVVVIAGKVLGNGQIDHKLTVSAYSISNSAVKKIMEAGGQVLLLQDFVNKYPDGRGVRILG